MKDRERERQSEKAFGHVIVLVSHLYIVELYLQLRPIMVPGGNI